MNKSPTQGELVEEIEKRFADTKNADELPEGDPLREKAKFLGDGVTQVVSVLRTAFPNPVINRLASVLWDVLGHGIVPAAIGPKVESVSFFATKRGPVVNAYLILPPNWGEMYHRDPIMQTGAIVFNGSKAVDVYNDKLDNVLQQRATMYEAEYLLTIKEISPLYEMNDYQKRVIAQFPEGVRSSGAQGLVYESKPFFVGQT
jgi:hypothetical protein